MAQVIQILLLLIFPYWSLKLGASPAIKRWLSPIILCYAFGILLRNLHILPLSDEISKSAVEITIVFAVPMLLYSTNIFKWLPFTKTALLSFSFCALAAIIGTILSFYVFEPHMEDAVDIAAMFTGLYIGGTANVQAIGLALQTNTDNIFLISTADIFVGGIYLLFLTSIARTFFGFFLPNYKAKNDWVENHEMTLDGTFNWKDSLAAIAFTVVIIGVTLGLTSLIYGNTENTGFVMLLLTSLGILASFLPFVKNWQSTYLTADYLLLIFSVALGMMADFSTILENGLLFIAFDALILVIAVFLHSLLAYFFKIDRDTFIITSVAAFYGTPFVAQIGAMIGNRQVIFAGILMSLLGYMVGNYLGLGVAWFLK